MNWQIQFFIAVILSMALTGCAATPIPKTIQIVKADAGKTIEVAKGDSVEVTLRGNPTTGYSWNLISGKDAVLKQVGHPTYRQDPAPQGKVGVGGNFTFRFEATEVGTAQLKFVYERPWEKDVPPAQTHEVIIYVR